jgi:membrane associated rhomboid family serine protease
MYRQPDPFHSIRGNIARAGVPFTISIIAITAFTFLVDNTFGRGIIAKYFWCNLIGPVVFPIWSPLTYSLETDGFVNVVFACLWLWSIGGSLERSWSTRRYALFFFGISLITALGVYIGTLLLHDEYTLSGVWIPLSAVTVAWATINPRQTVLAYFVLSIPAWVLAAFGVGLVYFDSFRGRPVLGLFGLLPCLAAYFYVRSGASVGRAFIPKGPDLRIVGRKSSTLDGSRSAGGPLGWYKAWQEQRRLRKLWRDSGFSDKDR